MNRIDRFIVNCPSFEEFRQRMGALSDKDKGDILERLTQVYLQTTPEYRTALEKVWLLRKAPATVLKAIGLEHDDKGIDLIARHTNGTYWAIQAKYRTDEDKALGWGDLSTFFGLSSAPRRNISLGVVVHTTARPISNRALMGDKVVEIGLDRWKSADWSLILRTIIENAPARPTAFAPRPEWKQDRVIAEAVKHFKEHTRGRLLMPCGTGKTLIAFWIAEALKAKTIIVAVPSLNLIKQSVAVWMRELVAKRQTPPWLCVASDDSVGGLDDDEFVDERYDSGLPTTTDVNDIVTWLQKPGDHKIIFTTYHSSKAVADAAKLAAVEVDLIIFDEAHRTAGAREREFATLLHDDAIKARRRLFMTATERKIGGDADVLFSMDDNEEDYGHRFFTMTFKEAIDLVIISDYKLVTYVVTDSEVRGLIKSNRLLNLGENVEEAEARDVAAGIVAKRVQKGYGVKHTVVFARSIRASKEFREQQDKLNDLGPHAENFHVDSGMSAGERCKRLSEFKEAPRALMTNARCLTEGVDVPDIDCVEFAAPKQSMVDIVQAAGRAMRKVEGKKFGYIIIPLVVPDNVPFEEFAETTPFRTVVKIINSLATQDERIVEELRAMYCEPTSKSKKKLKGVIKIGGTVSVGFRMSLDQFADAIMARVWDAVARVNWLPFEEARAFVRSLGLKGQIEWSNYAKSKKKPNDIPSAPWDVYAGTGWESLVDWLGNGRRVSGWRSFEDARSFVRSLGLKNYKNWFAYCKSEKKPNDIPAVADRIYADAGWVSWSDWIGTSNRRGGWRSFKEARAFVHKLKLKNVTRDWRAYCKSGKKPDDIPTNPPAIYADAGWAGWGDWLGNEQRQRGQWRDFKDARAFVRALKFESGTEWRAYCKSGKKHDDIPANPNQAYADNGWMSVADWLGSKRRIGGWRSFKEARAFARSLGLKSNDEWFVYCKSKKKPDDIPSYPHSRYANAGWRGWNDWLGKPEMLPFKKARAFVRTLGLKNSGEWATYCKSEKKPTNIPNTPYQHYADKGWVGWSDWLGNEWRSFNKARAFARSLGLETGSEWWTYCKSGKAPKDIPLCPQSVYAEAGWAGWNDWLGSGRKMLLFKEARAFVRGLQLKSGGDWREYCRSGKKPNDIPSAPQIVYADSGWAGLGDWLGADVHRVGNWREFEEARAFVRKLKLNNQKEWTAYCRSGKRPNDIPSTPEKVYAKAGWAGLDDWLGKPPREKVAPPEPALEAVHPA